MFDNIDDSIFDHSMNDDLFQNANSFGNYNIQPDVFSVESYNYLHHGADFLQNSIIDLEFPHHKEIDDGYFIGEGKLFDQHNELIASSNHHYGELHNQHISFTGSIYSDAEIRHLQEDVSKYEYEVSNLKSEVHHQEIMEDSSKLDKAVSDLNYAIDKLNDAREKLNNAT